MNPNPWQLAHDTLEQIYLNSHPGTIERELGFINFETVCRELLELYKKLKNYQTGRKPESLTFADAFFIGLRGGPNQVEKFEQTMTLPITRDSMLAMFAK